MTPKCEYKVGDWVCCDDGFYGQIVEVFDDVDEPHAYVEFSTGGGGGCLPFAFDELEPAEPPKEKVSDDRLTEIIRNAVRAYVFELDQHDYDDDAEIFAVLLNQFEMTESEFNSIMGCTFEQYR